MGDRSAIEWCDATWNPVVGCEKVSAGCANCYAVAASARITRMQPGNTAYRGLTIIHGNGRTDWSGEVRCLSERLIQPLNWRRPRRIFVNSMSDLFHNAVPEEFIWRVFAVMASAHRQGHIFQILTKRPLRMCEVLSDPEALEKIQAAAEGIAGDNGWCHMGEDDFVYPLPNVWLGVSVEDQQTADARVPGLLDTPAAIRFVSYEPALGGVDFTKIALRSGRNEGTEVWIDALAGALFTCDSHAEADIECNRLDWIICGGESGPNARPMNPDWARKVRDDIQQVNRAFSFPNDPSPIAFLFKQWGEWCPGEVTEDGPLRGYWNFQQGTGFHRDAYRPEDRSFQCEPRGEYRFPKVHYFSETSAAVRLGKLFATRNLDGRTWDEFPEPTALNTGVKG